MRLEPREDVGDYRPEDSGGTDPTRSRPSDGFRRASSRTSRPGLDGKSASALALDGLRTRFPRLVTCSISAYGGDGPARDDPGWEPLVHARAGAQQGLFTGDRPQWLPFPMASVAAALLGVIGVGAALVKRETTGYGQHVETSSSSTCLLFSQRRLPSSTGRDIRHLVRRGMLADTPVLRLYETSDGRAMQVNLSGTERWRRSWCCVWASSSTVTTGARLRPRGVIGQARRHRKWCDGDGSTMIGEPLRRHAIGRRVGAAASISDVACSQWRSATPSRSGSRTSRREPTRCVRACRRFPTCRIELRLVGPPIWNRSEWTPGATPSSPRRGGWCPRRLPGDRPVELLGGPSRRPLPCGARR